MSTKKAFAKPTASAKMRGCDKHGCGTFNAARGNHSHQGEDYIVAPGESVFSPISGTVTRFPRPYANDSDYTGIEIKNEKYDVKIFYMTPMVSIAKTVLAGDRIGIAQNIAAKYTRGMTNHIHVEVRDKAGTLLQISKLI